MTLDPIGLLASLSHAPADQPWLLWAIGAGVVCITAGFAYFGRLALRDSGPADSQPGVLLGEIDLKPVKSDPSSSDDLRAFVALARKLKLNRTQRLIIRRVAQASRTPAPAMLLSERAYDSAVDFVARDRDLADGCAERREFVRLRSRLFAE